MIKHIKAGLTWMAGEVWEKINFPAVWRELKELGVKHGKRFFVAAVIWELIEDGLFPVISWHLGVPELIPLFLIFHFEPISYPAIFWGFKMYDRMMGREPWEPDRSAMSSYSRTALKVALYRLASALVFWIILASLDLSLWLLTAYALLMTLFGYVHDRIWHDSNYGITPDDQVEAKRNVVKALTYRGVSLTIMATAFLGLLGSVPWSAVLSYQSIMLLAYLGLETIWSKTEWGITPV